MCTPAITCDPTQAIPLDEGGIAFVDLRHQGAHKSSADGSIHDPKPPRKQIGGIGVGLT